MWGHFTDKTMYMLIINLVIKTVKDRDLYVDSERFNKNSYKKDKHMDNKNITFWMFSQIY